MSVNLNSNISNLSNFQKSNLPNAANLGQSFDEVLKQSEMKINDIIKLYNEQNDLKLELDDYALKYVKGDETGLFARLKELFSNDISQMQKLEKAEKNARSRLTITMVANDAWEKQDINFAWQNPLFSSSKLAKNWLEKGLTQNLENELLAKALLNLD